MIKYVYNPPNYYSNYPAVDILLMHWLLLLYSPLRKVHVSTFSIPLKNHVDRLCDINGNFIFE